MTHRSSDRGPATRTLSPPRLKLLYEVHDPLAASERRSRLISLDGLRFDGPRMSGWYLPNSLITRTIQATGTMELEGFFALETDDGHRLFGRFTGLGSIAPENALALASGRAFDPETFYVRSCIRFEAADDGPYAWINRSLCMGTAIRLPQSFQTTVWQLL